MFIIDTQKYNPKAKNVNTVPDDKNNAVKNPIANSFDNALYSFYLVN